MTEPTPQYQLAQHLEANVADNDRCGIEGSADYIAEVTLDWLRAHPEIASALWPDGVEIYVDGKWVAPSASEVIAKIRRLEAEVRQAKAEAEQHHADASQRVKDLQAEFARQARVYERRIEQAQAALDGDTPKEPT